MCTAFVHRGTDVIYGFNMDINAEAFTWEVAAEKDAFFVAIKADESARNAALSQGDIPQGYADYTENRLRTHGVTSKGVLAVQLNCVGGRSAPFLVSPDAYPLYGMVDHLLSDRMTVREAEEIATSKRLVNMPSGSVDLPEIAMHALIADAEGRTLLMEPGSGWARFSGRYAVVSNFPLLVLPRDLNDERAGYYGLDRYETINRALWEADAGFCVQNALELLKAVSQTGRWATRVSFVWSKNENAVYYALEHDFDHVRRHAFAG